MIRFVSSELKRSKVTGLAVALLATCLLALIPAPAAQAALGDRSATTFNMQGATSGGDSTWSFINGRNWNSNSPIIALQEVGSEPPVLAGGTVVEPLWPVHNPHPDVRGYLPPFFQANWVIHSQWVAPDRRIYHSYFLQTDRNGEDQASFQGGRVNLDILSQYPVDDVAIVPNPRFTAERVGTSSWRTNTARAALGVRLENTWYFDIHAMRGGEDAGDLLNNIQTFVNARGQGEDALVLGDFNRNPGGPQYRDGQHPIPFMGPTQLSGNTLDYGVAINNNTAAMIARVQDYTGHSDHVPVTISPSPIGVVPPNAHLPTAPPNNGNAAPNPSGVAGPSNSSDTPGSGGSSGSETGSSMGQGNPSGPDAALQRAWRGRDRSEF